MKSTLAALALGLAALMLQGGLARALPPPWCPDLSWLVVVGLGLRWPGFVSGLLLTTLLGFAMDAVSGSLLGQHAFLRIGAYLVAAIAARQLDLSGGIPTALLTFVLSLGYGFGIVATRSVLLVAEPLGLEVFAVAAVQAIVNTVCAGPLIGAVDRIVNRFADEEVARRSGLALGHAGRSRP